MLVLGARGFLGSHIVAALRAAGSGVRVPPPGDLTAAASADWAGLLGGVSGVINAAGRTGGSPDELTRANALLPARLLEALARAGGHAGVKLVHLASAAEYGAVPEGHASREDEPARPLSPYGASKLAGTALIEAAARGGQISAVALRLTNPLGAGIGAGTLPGRAAQELTAAVRGGHPTVRFGPLGARRDFVDVRDAARAVLHALNADLSGVVNVGSGQARPVRDVVDGLAALSGYRGRILEDAPGSPRSGDVPYQRADISRLLDSGFVLRHSLDDSLRALLAGRTGAALTAPHSGLVSC